MSAAPSEEKPILIAGPTASGKSALALSLAARFGGEIINADSMQVYRELRVVTARPSPDDEARIPHALYGFVTVSEAYSVGRFAVDAARALAEAVAAGRRPIVVGGTGLYFKALLEGLSPIPPVPEEIRQRWRRQADLLGAPALHEALAQKDPDMARRLSKGDTQRIVRALEVLDATGTSLAVWQARPGTPVLDAAATIRIALLPPREILHERADARVDAMVELGAIEEARVLAELNLSPGLPALRALGLSSFMAAARGEITREAAALRVKAETRQYIKRQETWLKRNMIAWNGIFSQEMKIIEGEAITFIRF